MAKACAFKGCGARKAHPIHGQYHEAYHPYMVKPEPMGMSEAKRAYLDSEKHQAVYAEALGDKFCVGHAAGAPGRCTERLTPHHILPRSQAGGQEAAERFPVVMLCDWLNDAVQSIPEVREWAKSHYFHRNGRDYPFLLSAADVRKDSEVALRENQHIAPDAADVRESAHTESAAPMAAPPSSVPRGRSKLK